MRQHSNRAIRRPLAVGAVLLCLAGCAVPQWRIFQAKIDPKVAERPAAQVEAERSAAKFIAQKSAQVEAQPEAQIAEIHAVAAPLSASLGEPKRTVGSTVDERDRLIADLRQGVLAEQAKAEKWRAFARKYAGKEIEDTGINLAGPAGLLALAGIVAACIMCPAFGYILLRVLPVLWGFFSRTTTAIGEFVAENPDAGKNLKANLSRRMDEAHKALVRRRKPATP